MAEEKSRSRERPRLPEGITATEFGNAIVLAFSANLSKYQAESAQATLTMLQYTKDMGAEFVTPLNFLNQGFNGDEECFGIVARLTDKQAVQPDSKMINEYLPNGISFYPLEDRPKYMIALSKSHVKNFINRSDDILLPVAIFSNIAFSKNLSKISVAHLSGQPDMTLIAF